ncbi:MAG TPA: MATE family efflux transporter [Candidatus Gallacutalibacter stercoravium]|nr:MATE family efflux transporter [Candidatus Gallacutalibacter stercoravium]
MAENAKDMTRGKPGKLIFSFAVPLMLGNIFQQMYTMVDTMVVGQVVGVEALASLGAAEWLQWMILGLITGATQGFSILIAQRFGADDQKGLRKAVAMSILWSGAIAVVATVGGLLAMRPVLALLNTPENIVGNSIRYLTIIFAGMIAVTGYNILASILRALGNSRTPLVAMIIAALINVGLDLLFVAVFHWGVAGAAAATVIAQAFSCLFCFWVIRRMPILALRAEDWKWDGTVAKRLIMLGVPVVFQNTVISLGGMTVQYVINGFGFLYVAGFTAANKLYGLLEVAATSFGFSMATYAGQNLGARRLDRIRSGMRSACRMAVITALIISAAMFVFGKPLLRLFISGEPDVVDQVNDIAFRYLAVMSALLFVLYLLYVYRSALQGMGDTVTPMISGIVEMGMRTAAVLLLPLIIGVDGVYFAEVAAWLGATVLLMTAYYRRMRRLRLTEEAQSIGGAPSALDAPPAETQQVER